jgi:hypothetical protein
MAVRFLQEEELDGMQLLSRGERNESVIASNVIATDH